MQRPGDTGSTPSRVDQWSIGLSSWILQDGNYTDFEVGQRRQFALEFGYDRNDRLVPVEDEALACQYTGAWSRYQVTADLLTDAAEFARGMFVLDFGLVAYTRWMVLDDLEPPTAGTRLRGPISLGVDPFDYMDLRMRPDGVPPLIYTWVIEGIETSTTPAIRVPYGHPLYGGPDEGPRLVPDPTRESWQPVTRTRTWDDAHYRLRCSLEPGDPTETIVGAGPGPVGPMPDSPSAGLTP